VKYRNQTGSSMF